MAYERLMNRTYGDLQDPMFLAVIFKLGPNPTVVDISSDYSVPVLYTFTLYTLRLIKVSVLYSKISSTLFSSKESNGVMTNLC